MSNNPLLYSFCTFLAILVFGVVVLATVNRMAARWLCCGCLWDRCLRTAANEREEHDIYPREARFDWPRRPTAPTAPVPSFFRWPGRSNRPRMIRIDLPDTPPATPGPVERPDWPEPCYPQPPPYRMERGSVVNLPRYTKDLGPNDSATVESNRPPTPGAQV